MIVFFLSIKQLVGFFNKHITILTHVCFLSKVSLCAQLLNIKWVCRVNPISGHLNEQLCTKILRHQALILLEKRLDNQVANLTLALCSQALVFFFSFFIIWNWGEKFTFIDNINVPWFELYAIYKALAINNHPYQVIIPLTLHAWSTRDVENWESFFLSLEVICASTHH